MFKSMPQRIAILSVAPGYADNREPRYLNFGGPVFPLLPGHSPHVERQNGILLVEGHPYKYEKDLGERQTVDGWRFGVAFRLLRGYQVLIHNGTVNPGLKFPTADLAQAEQFARKLVTDNLALFGTALKTEIVIQDGTTYGPPLATCDGHAHKQGQAIKGKLARDLLPLEYHDPPEKEKGAAATAPDSSPTFRKGNAVPEDSSTDQDTSQVVLIVRYQQGSMPRPDKTFATGNLVDYEQDGQKAKPPAHNLADLRLELKRQGYTPDYTAWRWLDRGTGPRRRREVYVLRRGYPSSQKEEGSTPLNEPVDYSLLVQHEPPPPLPAPTTPPKPTRPDLAAAGHRSNPNLCADSFYRQTWTSGRDFGLRTTGGLGG